MSDIVFITQNALALALVWMALRLWFAIDRAFLRLCTIVLFCLGQYGWALLAFVLLCIAESAHRWAMAERRARDFYNGPWID